MRERERFNRQGEESVVRIGGFMLCHDDSSHGSLTPCTVPCAVLSCVLLTRQLHNWTRSLRSYSQMYMIIVIRRGNVFYTLALSVSQRVFASLRFIWRVYTTTLSLSLSLLFSWPLVDMSNLHYVLSISNISHFIIVSKPVLLLFFSYSWALCSVRIQNLPWKRKTLHPSWWKARIPRILQGLLSHPST